MIPGDMPRKMPLFVLRERTRHGRMVYYFRRGTGKRIRLPDYGDPRFMDAYQEALSGVPTKTPRGELVSKHSLKWLVAQYRQSAEYQGLSRATRRQRDNIFERVTDGPGGLQPFAGITKAGLRASLEQRKATPAAARNFLRTMRGLFQWAAENSHVPADPTAEIKTPKQRKSGGFRPWSRDDVKAYEERWTAGTKERVWLHVLLYTGLRRGDAVVIGRQHVKDGIATIKTEKSRQTVEVNIPIAAQLAATLAAGPTGDLAWICGARGEPLVKESFGNLFREACDEAGLKGKSAHGLRKLAATIAAEAGLSVAEIEALFGWEGGRMASLYTKSANRKALAIQAAGKIAKKALQG